MSSARPLIGIPTWSDRSSLYHSAPIHALGQPYVHAVQRAGGIPLLIPAGLDEESLQALATRVDGVLLAGGGDVDPTLYGQAPHPALRDVDRASAGASKFSTWPLAAPSTRTSPQSGPAPSPTAASSPSSRRTT